MSGFRNFSPRAAAELDEIVGWRLDHGDVASSAEQLLASVLAAGERLAGLPQLGRRLPNLLPDPYRAWSIPRWRLLLVYDPTTQPATILRVLNAAQDIASLLEDIQDPPGTAEG